MTNIWRECPSGRLSSGDLIQKSLGASSHLIANAFFEGGIQKFLSIAMTNILSRALKTSKNSSIVIGRAHV